MATTTKSDALADVRVVADRGCPEEWRGTWAEFVQRHAELGWDDNYYEQIADTLSGGGRWVEMGWSMELDR